MPIYSFTPKFCAKVRKISVASKLAVADQKVFALQFVRSQDRVVEYYEIEVNGYES